ncbi:MFS transporter [Allofournierella sp.]|uniref:MFS transporter n=1 Tax=Allofournierella sp. TaxID=1940256 RepID=UPI003AB86687
MVHLLLAVIYLSFISLGLPDSLLGAAWPSMYGEFGVPVSCAGALSMIIALGTVLSSLQSDRLTRKLGAGRVTLISVAMTALALLGFSASGSFWQLCLWAVPYGLGAGSVDAALNNYVALHYASRHMSWLHCMWGVGASLGPWVMGRALTAGSGWNAGYRSIALLQAGLTAILLASLPLWKLRSGAVPGRQATKAKALTLGQILRIPGAKAVMLTFFCYCALEQTAGLWASSYLVLHKGVAAGTAAGFAGLFFVGITVGRALSGFLTMRLNDGQMVRLGQGVAAAGIAALLLPLGKEAALCGLLLIGLGCAPIYPCTIHATPGRFGAGRSQAIIGVQMASAYVGTCLMPPLFGLIAARLSAALFPVYLLVILLLMAAMHELLLKRTGAGQPVP